MRTGTFIRRYVIKIDGFGENIFANNQDHFTKEKCMGFLKGVLRGDCEKRDD